MHSLADALDRFNRKERATTLATFSRSTETNLQTDVLNAALRVPLLRAATATQTETRL
jgi:hypothetical protein